LHAETEAVFALVLLEALRAAPGRDHLRRLEENSLLDLVVLPLLARLVHHRVVLDEPGVEDLLVNCREQDIPVHLAQELVELLLIPLELVALLEEQVLDALPVDRPVRERDLRVGKAVLGEVGQREVEHGASYELGGPQGS